MRAKRDMKPSDNQSAATRGNELISTMNTKTKPTDHGSSDARQPETAPRVFSPSDNPSPLDGWPRPAARSVALRVATNVLLTPFFIIAAPFVLIGVMLKLTEEAYDMTVDYIGDMLSKKAE